jgi:hypothetical protein
MGGIFDADPERPDMGNQRVKASDRDLRFEQHHVVGQNQFTPRFESFFLALFLMSNVNADAFVVGVKKASTLRISSETNACSVAGTGGV